MFEPFKLIGNRAPDRTTSGGTCIKKAHDRPKVDRVILVEYSQELLDWYSHDSCRNLPKVTDVICGDVYEQIGRFGTKAKHLLDIWRDYGECVQDEQFLHCRRLYKYVWGWGPEVANFNENGIAQPAFRPRRGRRSVA